MHLVWTEGRIFIKSLPSCLLGPGFWEEYAQCPSHLGYKPRDYTALGFRCSYAALIACDSDFYVAQEKGLIPSEVTWLAWRDLAERLHNDFHLGLLTVDSRFRYHELLLDRPDSLNRVHHLWVTPLRGYDSTWNSLYSLLIYSLVLLLEIRVLIALL